GDGFVETISVGSVTFGSGVGTITVGRAGGTLPFAQASNKIIAPSSISNFETGLNVTNNNGYGLQVTQNATLSGTPTYSVATGTASNVTQGLYVTGKLSGTGLTKTGNGTLVLGNATNDFTGNVDIQRGVVSVSSDGQLGTASNQVRLNPTSGTTPTSTFRATGTFATSRTIDLTTASNTRAIEVSAGNTLTLNSAFGLTAATAALNKGEAGTLLINASNTGWSGALNINQGAVLINNSALTSPAGTGTIFISPAAGVTGAALQLAGGVTVSNPLNLQNTANILNGGINFGGMLDNVSGTNTYSGGIAHPFDATIGARTGSTLNLTGLLTSTGTHRIQFNAEGDINWSGGQTGALFQIDKYGAGTMNISTPITGAISGSGGYQIHKGTLILSGTATTNSSGAANLVQSGAILRLDNSGTNTANRLTGRAVTLQGGTFDFIANNSTETAGAFVADQGASTLNNGGTGSSALTFSTFTGNAGGTLNVTGTFGTASNFVKFTTAPTLSPATTGLLARVTTNGNEFATYNATNGIVPFTGYATAT
ncbi:MAG: hypothetical protein EBU85_07380, partial [Actinobacteria bacterium]|nr:hypothetical protein [Actinomycetota bacterium]